MTQRLQELEAKDQQLQTKEQSIKKLKDLVNEKVFGLRPGSTTPRGMLSARRRRRRVRPISFKVTGPVLVLLNFGLRKWVKWAQWRGTILKTDKSVVITTPYSKVRFTKGTISPVP